MLWIKGNEKIDGSHLIWKDKAGNEFETFNPTEDFLIEQGWVKEEEVEEQVPEKSLKDIKEALIAECNEFYRSVILKVDFKGELIWIPVETRQAYIQVLKDAQEAGESKVDYRNSILDIEVAIAYLKSMNVYEFRCRRVRDNHVKAIIKLATNEELESYDYSTGYPESLSIS